MPLTTQQLATLKAAIIADGTLNAYPNTTDGNLDMASEQLNKLASPDFLIWNSRTPVQAVFDSIDWSKYTPTDAVDSTVLYSNRLLMIQTKQMNLQNILVGRDTVDATKLNLRAGLRDSVIQIPAGASGANVAAGGASGSTTLAACSRKALLIEKILTTGAASTGTTTFDLPGYEGQISGADVAAARNS